MLGLNGSVDNQPRPAVLRRRSLVPAADAESVPDGHFAASVSRRKVPLASAPVLLLAKALQHAVAQPDLLQCAGH